MTFDWQQFFSLAERLHECDSEAAQRTAISRAYYSIFHLASERARKNSCRIEPDPIQKGGTHFRCWGFYKKGPDSSCVEVGVEGDRLRAERVWADYKPGEHPRLKEKAAHIMKRTKRLKQKLAALDSRYPQP